MADNKWFSCAVLMSWWLAAAGPVQAAVPVVPDPATDWQRSKPDAVVYIPKDGAAHDTDNEHFLVFPSPSGKELLALWTQSSVEGRGDNRAMLARSADGVHWAQPIRIAGTTPGTKEPQAGWAFPVVARSGRIYVFYTKQAELNDGNPQGCGKMGCRYSDDGGHSWRDGADIPMPRNRFDNPDPNVPKNWIVWQKPVRDRQGRWLAGYTQVTSPALMAPEIRKAWWRWESRCQFMRFENLDGGPDPKDIKITWLPEDEAGLEVPHPNTGRSSSSEPSVVLLPDGRLFTTIRTWTGQIWFAVSDDDGRTWCKPEIMRYQDEGEPVLHPLAPCPIYALQDGRYVLVFHNNNGHVGSHNQREVNWKGNHLNYIRHPAYIAVGEFRPNAQQPIWFSAPKLILDTDGVVIGPKKTAEIATYTSLTEWHGRRVLWYPDRKYYLLGKYLPDELLADMKVPQHFTTAQAISAPPPSERELVKLPRTDNHWKRVASYMEEEPDADYRQAPPAAREAFQDLKYGVRIHWGLYSKYGIEASWDYLKMTPDEKQAYLDSNREFNPVHFNAGEWMDLFQRNGIKVFAFTAKHHDGFSMYDTKTRVRQSVNWTAPGGPRLEACNRAFSIMEGPFKRDIVKELCDAARQRDIKINLYFSHPDFFDADFRPYCRHPLQTPSAEKLTGEPESVQTSRGNGQHIVVPDPTPEETRRMMARHRAQLAELLTNYGPIDQLCLDMWFGPAVWPQLRETIKYLRTLQPGAMFRARGIGNYGDYYTPEKFVPDAPENTAMPWMVIYPLAGIFAYQPDAAQYKGGDWIVRNLVDSVAKGGNFMFGIGPDETGRFHPKAIAAIEEAGAWLRVNGEAIYNTRPRPGELWREGDDIRFTRTKDHQFLFALALKWPGEQLVLRSVRARRGSAIVMLGVKTPLDWRQEDEGHLVIDLPPALQNEPGRPCRHAFVFKIANEVETQ